MKIKQTKHYEDYREAILQWNSHKPSLIHYHEDGTFTVEWIAECNNTPDLMREFLLAIKLQNDLPQEQIDALAYADSAIKTLVDMEILQ